MNKPSYTTAGEAFSWVIESMHRIYFLILLFASLAFAQIESEFSGYLLDLPVYQKSNFQLPGFEDEVFLNLTRLRLRPTLYFGNHSRLALEWEVDGVLQSAANLFTIGPDKTNRQLFEWRWYPLQEEHITVTHFIDRLYFRHDFSFGNLVIGRQRVAWGTGRIWNPGDLFNPINPASFFKITDLTLVYNPLDEGREDNAGFRFRSNYGTYDLALLGGYFDERYVIGGDFAGNLLTAGLRGEGIISANTENLSSNYVKYILGIDYQFSAKLYSLLEYQYNGQGSRNTAGYDLAALFKGEIINLAKNYIFVNAAYQLNPLLNTIFAYNANLDDRSGFVTLQATFSLKSNLDLGAGAQLTWGGEFSEYWYYGNSLFLQGSFYF
jgi:hypothetical protein